MLPTFAAGANAAPIELGSVLLVVDLASPFTDIIFLVVGFSLLLVLLDDGSNSTTYSKSKSFALFLSIHKFTSINNRMKARYVQVIFMQQLVRRTAAATSWDA